jgi:hypothetical protein
MRMKNKINSLDAPLGYKAVSLMAKDKTVDICFGCAFVNCKQCGMDRRCTPMDRKDKQHVIFIKQ